MSGETADGSGCKQGDACLLALWSTPLSWRQAMAAATSRAVAATRLKSVWRAPAAFGDWNHPLAIASC